MHTTSRQPSRLIHIHTDCHRCGGLMVPESLPYENESERTDSYGLRCLNCGELVDPLIMAHRYQRPLEVPRRRAPHRRSLRKTS